MAGNYMDAPAARVAYDRDGTLGTISTTAGVLTQLTQAQLASMNSESEVGVTLGTASSRIALVFPVPMDLKAVFFSYQNSAYNFVLETSPDTTTGLDGTWTQQATSSALNTSVKPSYRVANNLLTPSNQPAATGIRGVRIRCTSTSVTSVNAFHVYADVSASATSDRLALWQPTVDQKITPAFFDWGNTPRASTADKTFRIKNLSSSLTASNINCYVEALFPGSPTVNGMHTLSADGTTFLNSILLASLAPGAISPVLTLRRTVPSNAQVSVWSARLAADVGSWA